MLGADLERMLAGLPATLLGRRDQALLLVGFAGAFHRPELVALDWEDIEWGREGLTGRGAALENRGRAGKKDRHSPTGREAAHCSVRALESWRDAVRRRPGSGLPARRPPRKPGARAPVLQDRGADCETVTIRGNTPATSCAPASPPPPPWALPERSTMNQTGHRSLSTVRRYIRDGSLFQETAVAKTGL